VLRVHAQTVGSPLDEKLARTLARGRVASARLDLLSGPEMAAELAEHDIALLAERLVVLTQEFHQRRSVRRCPLAYVGFGPAAAPALWAAGELKRDIAAVVALGGRPEVLGTRLAAESGAVLLVTAADSPEATAAELARRQAPWACELLLVPGVDPLTRLSGTADVAGVVSDWLAEQLAHAARGALRHRRMRRRVAAASALATAGAVLATASPAHAGITFQVVGGSGGKKKIAGTYEVAKVECRVVFGPGGPVEVVFINGQAVADEGGFQIADPAAPEPGIPANPLLWENLELLDLNGTTSNDYLELLPSARDLPVKVNAGDGDDTVITGDGNDTVVAGGGNDSVYGGGGNDSVTGGLGSDSIVGGSGASTGRTTLGVYWLLGETAESDTLDGGAGNDTLLGRLGDDQLLGGLEDDVIDGGEGADTLDAAEGNDTLDAGLGVDALFGGAGDDSLIGGAGNDVFDGGDGNDAASGGGGNDAIEGSTGNDTLTGALGRDTLSGGPGDDNLAGGKGNDRLEGGPGSDRGDGGPGKDVCATEQKVRCP
jgi:hypothetical protein